MKASAVSCQNFDKKILINSHKAAFRQSLLFTKIKTIFMDRNTTEIHHFEEICMAAF